MFERADTSLLPPDAAREATVKDFARQGGEPAGRALRESSLHCLREGVFLRCVDAVHPRSDPLRATLRGKCVKVLVKLEGVARARLGRRELPMDAGRGGEARPKGLVLCLERPEKFECRPLAGERQRLVVVTLTAAWFASGRQLAAPAMSHLETRCWTPTSRAAAIAEQLLVPTAFRGPMRGLYLESRTLELVAEAFARTSSPEQTPPLGLTPDACARACRLRDFLDSGGADALSLAEIARRMGCNATTLQQQFRQVFDTTIFDYLRASRLRRAAWALEHDGASVARAAEIAGYASQA
ncbi:MAG: AraC family transcriptional regulator, partial [Candidatus Accumulibacter sp.]|nr:AraC family transcriptional regulator [Accumulibacter sp.]